MRAAIFAHYDALSLIDEYVYFYLTELLKVVDKLVFVTVVDLSQEDRTRLRKLGADVISRNNLGYDFSSYKCGIDLVNLQALDELIICNDSVYGPLMPLIDVFNRMDSKEVDFWGITSSSNYSYHLQSYFLVFRRNVLRSNSFQSFWRQLGPLHSKEEVIQQYEIGLSSVLLSAGFKATTFVDQEKVQVTALDNVLRLLDRAIRSPAKLIRLFRQSARYVIAIQNHSGNLALLKWRELLSNGDMPFLKVSLFFSSPDAERNRMTLRIKLQHNKFYPVQIAVDHIQRNSAVSSN